MLTWLDYCTIQDEHPHGSGQNSPYARWHVLGRRVSSISFFIWRKQVCIISSPLRSQRPNHRNLLLFTDKLTNFRIYLVVLQIKTMHSSQYTHLIHIEFCLYSTFSLVINSGCHKPISFLHNVPYLYVGLYMIHEHNVTSNESTFNKLVWVFSICTN